MHRALSLIFIVSPSSPSTFNRSRLTGDIKWPVSTPFETAVGKSLIFTSISYSSRSLASHGPDSFIALSTGPLAGSFPLLSLRTNKADVAVGVPQAAADELDKKGEKWRVSGKYVFIFLSGAVSYVSALLDTSMLMGRLLSVQVRASIIHSQRISSIVIERLVYKKEKSRVRPFVCLFDWRSIMLTLIGRDRDGVRRKNIQIVAISCNGIEKRVF